MSELGEINTNGKIVAEQIGAQIFIDGWAMVAPGEPDLASELALKAASVSHDGEALYAAQVIAAMESQAFLEDDINRLIDVGISFIPNDSKIYRMINDIRDWRAGEEDWRAARKLLDTKFGYSNFEGICPVVPNHGLIILSLLYGEDDFQKTLMIVNTSGWDTDCNSGNIGCLMGIKNGLAGIDSGPDWRGPVADNLYLSTAEGGRSITDAVRETYFIVNTARALKGKTQILPKNGARFHFELPGSVQGFEVENSFDTSSSVIIKNILGHSKSGNQSLAIRFNHMARGQTARVTTATFISPKEINMPGYQLMASPTLYSGQTIGMGISADEKNLNKISFCLFIRTYGAGDKLNITYSPKFEIEPDTYREFNWKIDDTGGRMWRRAWVNGVDHFEDYWPEPYRIIQDYGTGLIIQGTREWTDYSVSSEIIPHLSKAAGIGARVQGMRRYYALLLCENKAKLVKALDGNRVLAEVEYHRETENNYLLCLKVHGKSLQAWINGQLIFQETDNERPLLNGGVAFICEEGCLESNYIAVKPD